MGNFYEMGPFQVLEPGVVSRRNETWLDDYHMIYIDNPVGSGYSFVGSDDDYVTS